MNAGARIWYSAGTGIAVLPIAFAFLWRGQAPTSAAEWSSLGLNLLAVGFPVGALAFASGSDVKWIRWTAFLLFAASLAAAVISPFLLLYLVMRMD